MQMPPILAVASGVIFRDVWACGHPSASDGLQSLAPDANAWRHPGEAYRPAVPTGSSIYHHTSCIPNRSICS